MTSAIGLSEAEREARLVVELAEHWCAALHPPAPQVVANAADPRHRVAACFACQRTAAQVVEDWLAARESAAATRARAEGAAEAGERIARAIEAHRAAGKWGAGRDAYEDCALIARSDAAPHTGGQS